MLHLKEFPKRRKISLFSDKSHFRLTCPSPPNVLFIILHATAQSYPRLFDLAATEYRDTCSSIQGRSDIGLNRHGVSYMTWGYSLVELGSNCISFLGPSSSPLATGCANSACLFSHSLPYLFIYFFWKIAFDDDVDTNGLHRLEISHFSAFSTLSLFLIACDDVEHWNFNVPVSLTVPSSAGRIYVSKIYDYRKGGVRILTLVRS